MSLHQPYTEAETTCVTRNVFFGYLQPLCNIFLQNFKTKAERVSDSFLSKQIVHISKKFVVLY